MIDLVTSRLNKESPSIPRFGCEGSWGESGFFSGSDISSSGWLRAWRVWTSTPEYKTLLVHPLPGTFFPFFSASQFISLYLSHFLHLSLLLSQCGALVQRRAIHPFVLMREVGEDSHWLLDWASLTELSLRLDTGCACACSPAKRRVDPFRERACFCLLNSIPHSPSLV